MVQDRSLWPHRRQNRDGVDVDLEQIGKGSAWVFAQCLRELPVEDRKPYLEAERQAKSECRGLWRDNDPEPPWQWRRERRTARSS